MQTESPAGDALAVDRMCFAKCLTDRVTSHPNIEIVREEAPDIPGWSRYTGKRPSYLRAAGA